MTDKISNYVKKVYLSIQVYIVVKMQPDLEQVFNVPRILNLPFTNLPQIIKFGSKVRRNNEKFDRALRVSV
jgi:hypothetical protein